MLLLPALTLLLATCQAQREVDTTVSESIGDITWSTDAEQTLHRNAEIISRLAETPAQGVRKMSSDEGEKFFLDYWQFLDNVQGLSERETNDETMDDETPEVFLERSFPLQPPSLPSDLDNPLQVRDFKCPTGTYGCTSIGRPNRCCGAGETSLGGGCCIPGYECVPGGCAYISVITVTLQSTVMVSTRTYSTEPQSTPSSTSSSHTSNTKTESLAPPARPTSLSTATTGEGFCPTGFYACSAVYHGGCCQTGRDCDTTSCPTTSSTTLTTDGRTIVLPVTATAGNHGGGGRCARGWFSCADTVGGGCCPSGFMCGSSCTATAASSTTVSKEQATNGGNGLSPGMLGIGVGGLGMLLL
ncbi:hypothetical protein N7474_008062 [Penicillium riverlandense]|uniref:uncharacterized protein n=1 Tax=Penicillium riverlandense TaxID=1903569 RepID=UPI0025486FE4|nr:uncharacterized protein N7474_008062 [Penicillium riverlandense]KAJ5811761.1 hypothetical protein N7474_008062 [Penicillium riverlandense]